MKKVFDTFRNIFTAILLVIAVAVMIFTCVSSFVFDRNDRNLFGYKAFIVLSDSMKTTDFEAGDVVVVKEIDPSELKEGDIITFVSRSSANYGETVTHKIRALTTDVNGNPVFVTYGTTTDTDDETPVVYSDVSGKYLFRLPKLGTAFNFLKTVPGYLLCIFLPFLLLIGSQILNAVKAFKVYRIEQEENIQTSKNELEAERKRNEEMRAELEALKEQMDKNKNSSD